METVQEGVQLEKREAKATWVTPDGYYRGSRGARHLGVRSSEFLLGESGRGQALAARESELKDLNQRLTELSAEEKTLSGRIGELEALLAGHDAAGALAARADEFRDADMEATTLQAAIQKAGDELAQAKHLEDEAQTALRETTGKVARQEELLNNSKKSLESAQLELTAKQETMASQLQEIRQKFQGAPPGWHVPATRKELVTHPDCHDVDASVFRRQVEYEADWVQRNAEGKDEQVVLIYDKEKGELSRLETTLLGRKAMREQTLTLVDQQRGRYINVLKGTAGAYLKNVRALAEMAGIEAISHPPSIENNDVSLTQAGIQVVFRFDQKPDPDYDPSDSSGGQKVMKSMVLLVALMLDEQNPSGVVFVDEPFAHLDILNIDRVATFLKRTNAQFIVTTPVTHNLNIYTPSRITLVTQTLRPGERHAPPIAVATRRETADV